MNVKDKDGKIVNWTLSPIKENSSNTVVNNNQTTENNNQIIKNNQDKGISANKNINTTDVSITPTFNQKEPLTGKG